MAIWRGAGAIAMASVAKHAEVRTLGLNVILDRVPKNLGKSLGSEKVTVVADGVGGDQ